VGERTDYSGEFNPALRFEDFSRETLIKLLGAYAKLYQTVDGLWYTSVKEKFGNEEAVGCDFWVWQKQTPYEMARLCRALKIERDGVAGLMKALQFGPWCFTHKLGIELNGRNAAILTISYCPTLEVIEREGTGREGRICGHVDFEAKKRLARFFHPMMEVRPLRLPPRQEKDGVCCQWEFRIPASE
jgi:hypothetical protein